MKANGILFDLEGVLYQDGKAVRGACSALEQIQSAQIPVRFLTNTSTKARAHIARQLVHMGFQISPEQLFTPAIAAGRYLKSENVQRIYLATDSDLAEDFKDFALTQSAPDAVVMGDLHTEFDWQTLNRIFNMIMEGARLIALHRNRYCQRAGHIALDLGPFVRAVEYAAGVEAFLVGKPEQAFFELALAELGVSPEQCVMIGDDPFSDITGAKHAGLMAVQVKTGKYRLLSDEEMKGTVAADAVLDSISDLPEWIGIKD